MKILKEFFCSKGKFQPPYFWITLLMVYVLIALGLKFGGNKNISDGLIGILVGQVVIWVKFYNDNRKNNGVKK